ncbi:MAG: 50S ribosomal protein L32 [Verrucomicrobiales bacterium]|jgi:large subunit ribosomal protein L32|nr:50S ribosomal protein L32 [Verrucomicrobiales bacterium]
MGVPKRKTSKMRSRMRKASQRKDPLQLRTDSRTHHAHRGHTVDPKTGLYRGRQVLTVSAAG